MDGWMVHPVNHTSIHPFRAFKYPFIHCSMPESMGSAPVGVPCPLTSSLGEFPGYWDWLWYPGLPPGPLVLVSIAFPLSPSISQCFCIRSSPAIHFCFFFMTDVSAPFRSTLHSLMVSFQAWDWLWYPMLWFQWRSIGCA